MIPIIFPSATIRSSGRRWLMTHAETPRSVAECRAWAEANGYDPDDLVWDQDVDHVALLNAIRPPAPTVTFHSTMGELTRNYGLNLKE